MKRGKNPNKKGTYKIINQEGKVVEQFRVKFNALKYLRVNKDMGLKIENG